MAKSLVFRRLYRELADGGREELEFAAGVNLIVGAPNTGKTVWLRMLDYLLGDTGGPETALPEELVKKYVAIGADAEIDGELVEIERRWNAGAARTKTRLDGATLNPAEFSAAMLERLDLPSVNYPKGDPYAERSWPTLSWRELLRHIYRQERFWTGIAPQQPDSTAHAALTLFLGLAGRLFSPLLGDLIAKRRELFKLRARKEQFQETVDQIARDLMPEQERDASLTALTLEERIRVLEEAVRVFLQRRDIVLAEVDAGEAQESLSRLAGERKRLLADLERAHGDGLKLVKRLDEVRRLAVAVEREREQLVRARVAGTAFADLKVTHCPACDQRIVDHRQREDECFLCHQQLDSGGTRDRIAYELDQLEQEHRELEELRRKLNGDIAEQDRLASRARERLDLVERDLVPARSEVSAAVSTEVGRLDVERGRIEERIRQLNRFKLVLTHRDSLNEAIDRLAEEVGALEAEQTKLESGVSFENSSALVEDAMNHFTNLINQGIERYGVSEAFKWTHGSISLDLAERSYRFRVRNQSWGIKLGATVQVHFLLAYHYALLRLATEPGRHYPGLVILDFPPNLLDAETVGDKENYLLEPFVELCKQAATPLQVIVAGRAFEGLEVSTLNELDHVWS